MPIGGAPCPVSSELFAITADAHLLRGGLMPEQCTCTFPDDRGTSLPEVRSRLARVVCADPEQLADGDLEAVAAAVHEAQVAAIASALERVAARRGRRDRGDRRRRGGVPRPRGRERCGLAVRSDTALAAPFGGRGGEVAAAVALSVLGRD